MSDLTVLKPSVKFIPYSFFFIGHNLAANCAVANNRQPYKIEIKSKVCTIEPAIKKQIEKISNAMLNMKK